MSAAVATPRTLDWWRAMVRQHVAGDGRVTRDDVARECYRREQAGENCAIWHVCATLTGRRCYCAECGQVAS